MTVFLNGEFVPVDQAVVSVFDRSFLYGDGLFETLRVYASKPFRWEQHLARLCQGAQFLKIRLPFSAEELYRFATRLIQENNASDSILRLSLSRGVGTRGYSTKGANQPSLVMSVHPSPPLNIENPNWHLITSSFRLPAGDPLAHFKTCNKLPQIFARAEAEAQGADEALLLNTDGAVAEAASGNLFWIEGNSVCTVPLTAGILPGITRSAVLEICHQRGIPSQERTVECEELREVDAVFVSLSSSGIVQVNKLDHRPLKRSSLTKVLSAAYRELIAKECEEASH